MTEHGGENVLQQGQDVLVGLEQTPHCLQLHHLCVWALCDWEVKQARVSYRMQRLVDDGQIPATYCCVSPPR